MKKCTLIVLAAAAVMGFASTAFAQSPYQRVIGSYWANEPVSSEYSMWSRNFKGDYAFGSYWANEPVSPRPASVGRAVKGPASDLYYIHGEERASDGAMSSYWQPARKPVVAALPR